MFVAPQINVQNFWSWCLFCCLSDSILKFEQFPVFFTSWRYQYNQEENRYISFRIPESTVGLPIWCIINCTVLYCTVYHVRMICTVFMQIMSCLIRSFELLLALKNNEFLHRDKLSVYKFCWNSQKFSTNCFRTRASPRHKKKWLQII